MFFHFHHLLSIPLSPVSPALPSRSWVESTRCPIVASLVRHAARDYGPRNPHCRDAPLNFKSFCGSSLAHLFTPVVHRFAGLAHCRSWVEITRCPIVASLVRHAANEQRLTQPTFALTSPTLPFIPQPSVTPHPSLTSVHNTISLQH